MIKNIVDEFSKCCDIVKSKDPKCSDIYRFSLIKKLDEISNYFEDDGKTAKVDFEVTSIMWPIWDAYKFIQIVSKISEKTWLNIKKEPFRKVMALESTINDEDDNTNPRNLLFEIECATIFIEAGYSIEGWDDVSLNLNNRKLVIECKRPRKESNLRDNLLKAYYKQLWKKTNKFENYGIIAIATDKMFNFDKQFLISKNGGSIIEEIKKLTQKAFTDISTFNLEHSNEKFIGVILSIPCLDYHSDKQELRMTRLLEPKFKRQFLKKDQDIVDRLYLNLINSGTYNQLTNGQPNPAVIS